MSKTSKEAGLVGCFIWGLIALLLTLLGFIWVVVRTVALAWRG